MTIRAGDILQGPGTFYIPLDGRRIEAKRSPRRPRARRSDTTHLQGSALDLGAKLGLHSASHWNCRYPPARKRVPNWKNAVPPPRHRVVATPSDSSEEEAASIPALHVPAAAPVDGTYARFGAQKMCDNPGPIKLERFTLAQRTPTRSASEAAATEELGCLARASG